MIPNFAIATAATEPYLKKLAWTIPTWPMKPQFKGKKLYIFYHGINPKKLDFVREYFPDLHLIAWDMPEYENVRELMLSAFVLGVSKYVKEDYCVKMDADAFFIDEQDVFCKDDFGFDLVAHRWKYTKPKWWVHKMDHWIRNREDDWHGEKVGGSCGHSRIISWCCLQSVEFIRNCVRACPDRLPIPSHDSFLWYMADNLSDCSWRSKNLKDLGVSHCSRWRSIRENICAYNPWNPYLNKCLLEHVQLEITTACNLACPSCDRNCGTAPSSERMGLDQVKKFVDESIEAKHQWRRIDVIGGEPTLHPEFGQILEEIKRYREWANRCKVRVTSNGTGEKVKRVLAQVPDWIEVRNSEKEKGKRKFEAVNDAPIDKGIKDALSCSIPWRCGLGLSRYGYFLCGAGASIARVFGLGCGVRSIDRLTIEALQTQQKELCKLCGHSRSVAEEIEGQRTSKSWKYALKHYKRNSDKLRLY